MMKNTATSLILAYLKKKSTLDFGVYNKFLLINFVKILFAVGRERFSAKISGTSRQLRSKIRALHSSMATKGNI